MTSSSYAGPWPGKRSAERLCGALFVGLTILKGYFYINLGGTLIGEFQEPSCFLKSELIPSGDKRIVYIRGP